MNDKIENIEAPPPDPLESNLINFVPPNPSLKPPHESKILLEIVLQSFFFRVLPIILLLTYSHLESSSDDFLSIICSISGYLLIIIECQPDLGDAMSNNGNLLVNGDQILSEEQKTPKQMNSRNSEISISQKSEISQSSHKAPSNNNLEQPLISPQQAKLIPLLFYKKIIYYAISILLGIQFILKMIFILVLFFDDSAVCYEKEHQTFIEFLEIYFHKDQMKDLLFIFRKFVLNLAMFVFFFLLSLYIRKHKLKSLWARKWNINRVLWKLRLEALLIIGMIFAPFFCYSLMGIPYIIMTVGFMICIMRKCFLKGVTNLLRIYIIFDVFVNHFTNSPFLMNTSAMTGFAQNRKYYGIDLYSDFANNFYNISLIFLLIFLLILLCLYTQLLDPQEKAKPKDPLEPVLPLPTAMWKVSPSFVSVISSQEEKESRNLEKSDLKAKLGSFFWSIYNLGISFFQSLETIIRFLQIYSIVIVMRFENIYPLGCLVWLLVSSIAIDHLMLSKLSAVLVIPLTSAHLIILYYSNIPNNDNIQPERDIFGFQVYIYEGIEYLILMIYLILQLAYVFRVRKVQKKEKLTKFQSRSTYFRPSKEKDKEVTFLKVAESLLYKNSYYFVLFILFWISLYTVNLIHLILALFFVVFFLKTGTNSLILKESSDKKSTSQKNGYSNKIVYTFQQKYWIYLVIYVDFIILLRHIWTLFIVKYAGSYLDSEYIDFVGLNYDYNLGEANFGFRDVDFASNTINWILFIFVVIQYDTYKSKLFLNCPDMMTLLKEYRPIQGRFYDTLEKIIRWIYIGYFKSILWIGYLVLISVLLIIDISVINTVVLLITLVVLLWHLFQIQAKKVKFQTIYRLWLFLTFFIVLMNLLRYTFQFFRFQLLQQVIGKVNLDDFFGKYGTILGLYFYEPICDNPDKCKIYPNNLRFRFIYNIILLFFAVMGYSYLALVVLYEKTLSKSIELSESNPREPVDLELGNNQRLSVESDTRKEIGYNEYLENIRRFFNEYVNISLRKEIPGLERFLYYACLFYISIMFFFLMLFCIFFMLSFANFIYLLFYLIYFYKLHSAFIGYSFESNLFVRMKEKVRVFKNNFLSLEALTEEKFIPEHDYNGMTFINDLNTVKVQCLTANIYYKKKLWKITIVFSVFCLFLTFISQYCVIEFLQESDFNKNIKWGLFLFGTYNCDGRPLIEDAYPYYIFVILNLIELKSILFLEEITAQKAKKLNLSYDKTHDSLMLPIKSVIQKPNLREINFKKENINQTLAFKIQNFFKNQARSLKYELCMTSLNTFEIVYLTVFLINSVINYTFFSLLTFLSVVYLCLRSNSPSNILRILNDCSLMLLFIRYIFFLLNINHETSPRRIPVELWDWLSLDLIDHLFQKSDLSPTMYRDLKEYLALGEKNYDHASFFFNSIILYIVQIYFLLMFLMFKRIYECIEKRKTRLDDFQMSLILQYKNWIGTGMKLLTVTHAFLYVNVNLIVCFFMIFFLLFNESIYNYIFCILFILTLIVSQNYLLRVSVAKSQKISQFIFKTLLILFILLLLVVQIIHIPILLNPCKENIFCSQTFSTSIWDKLAGLIILKLTLNLIATKDYARISANYLTRKALRADLLRMCYSYDENDRKIKSWLEKLENKLIVKEKVRFVIQKLEQWHAKYFSSDSKSRGGNNQTQTNEIPALRSQSSIRKISKENYIPEKPRIEKLEENQKKHRTIREKLMNFFTKHQDKFLFLNLLTLTNFIYEKNRNILGTQIMEITDYMFNRFDRIDHILRFLEHLQSRLIKTLKHALKNPEKLERINSSESDYEKFLFGLYEEVLRSLKSELPGPLRHDPGPGRLLIRSPIKDGFLDLNEFESGWFHSEKESKPTIVMLLIKAFEFLISKWSVISSIFIVFYIFFNNGLVCLLLPAFFFGFLMLEEKAGKEKTWGILAFFFLFILICKFTIRILEHEKDADRLARISIALGNDLSINYEYFLVVILIIQVNLLRRKGLDKRVISQNENVYQSFLRKKLNNDFEDIQKNNEIIQELFKSQEEEESFPKEEEKERKPSFEDGGFYLRFLQDTNLEKLELLPRQTSFSKRFYESSAQCNYDKVKWKAINEMEREVMCSILEIKLHNFNNTFFRILSLHNRKSGKDLYKYVLTVQIIIAIYIFLLFSKMLGGTDDSSITDSVKYSTFSGRMVLALFFHFAVMFIERIIMLYNPSTSKNDPSTTSKAPSTSLFSLDLMKIKPIRAGAPEKILKSQIFLKYLLHIILLIFIAYFILIFVPTHGTNNIQDKLILNNYAVFFFLFYCLYFYYSAVQLKFGLRDRNKLTTLQIGYTQFQSFLFRVYKVIPFLFEFKTFMDWYFTETALSLVQWIKMEEINGKLFLAKCSSVKFKQRVHGRKVKWWIKFLMGGCGVFLLVLCIFGPMLLFSTFNPIAEQNLVQSFTLRVGIRIDQNQYFKFFEASNVIDIKNMNETEFSEAQFDKIPAFKSVDRGELQRILIQQYSDEVWALPRPLLNTLNQSLEETLDGKATHVFDFLIDYSMKRQRDSNLLQSGTTTQLTNNSILQDLKDSIGSCQQNEPIEFPRFQSNTIRISSNSEISLIQDEEYLVKDIYLSLVCDPDTKQSYWSLSSDRNMTMGITYYTVSNKAISEILGYSVIGFYVGVVYLIGKLLRGAISNKAVSFLFSDLPDPDALIRLCESIKIARQEKNHYLEELFYFELMDLLKSPDVVKQITGSSVQTIKEKEKQKKT